MNTLIIGYGSIGKRHYEVLKSLTTINTIGIVTSQSIPDVTTYTSLENVNDLDFYDYFIIASETYKHYEQLHYLDTHTKNKIILCEKPLFSTYTPNTSFMSNQIYIGYVLRFHPIIQKIHTLLKNDNALYTQIRCGSYLPFWRPGTDYRQSYSASKSSGGGVLLDLSHELDYMQWLFGVPTQLTAVQTKISDLEINSDDLVVASGTTDKGVVFNLSLDYISKVPFREIIIHTFSKTIYADLINNILRIGDKEGNVEPITIESYERNDLFIKMHLSALTNHEYLCTLNEGLNVMKTISSIQEQNHG